MALFVGEGVYIGCQACRRRRIDSGDMMIDTYLHLQSVCVTEQVSIRVTYLLARIPRSLLDQLHKIRRAQFSQSCEDLCSRIDGFMKDLFSQPAEKVSAERREGSCYQLRRSHTQGQLAQPS
jgi:hypothetical protein